MKRAGLLLVLVTLVIWLAQATPVEAGLDSGDRTTASTSNTAAPSAALPQGSCCANPGETDPHWECFDGACVQVSGCGQNVNCASCGCNSTEEWACITNGGYWDPYTCTCEYSCDPDGSQESACYWEGGTWDQYNCICYPPQCNPGPPIETYSEHWWDYYCNGYVFVDCENWCSHYVQYCQDGSVYDQWTECTDTCIPSDDYCGGGGGCLDWCYCEDGWCCDWDYCWEEEDPFNL